MTKEQKSKYNKTYRQNNRIELLKSKKKYRQEQHIVLAKKQRHYYHEHREEILAWKRQYNYEHRKERQAYAKRYHQDHKEEIAKKSKLYRRKRRDDIAAWDRKRNYGISEEEYNTMLAAQKGKCFICGEREKNGHRLGVDHNHQTGKVRRLLCKRCNRFLGAIRESVVILKNMLSYIKRFSTQGGKGQ